MKKKGIISIFIAVFFTIAMFESVAENPSKKSTMPENVKAIVKTSCFGCHNSDSKNEDGKEALDFKKFDQLSLIKKVSAYTEIGDVVEENEMPPKKFLERYPGKALSEDDKKVLMAWSKKEAEALVKSK